MTTFDREHVAAAIRYTPPLRPVADQPERVVAVTARMFGFTVDEVVGRSRKPRLEDARRVAMAVVRATTTLSWREIGEVFGDRDHTTVIQSVQRTLKHPVLRSWAAAVDAEVQAIAALPVAAIRANTGSSDGTIGSEPEEVRPPPGSSPTPDRDRSEHGEE